MKTYKIISLVTITFLMAFVGCQPIDDRDSLINSTDIDGVELVVTHSSPGGNKIELSMITPGIVGYWDYNLGRAYSDKVEIVYPIPGTSTFTFVGTLGAEFFSKTIEVQIDQLDTALDQDWYDLVSEETSTGKTWVFNNDPNNGLWWYMSPNDDPTAFGTAWWNAGECCPPVDVSGSMIFDLDGGANFTYYASEGADAVMGSFVLDVANQTLKINNANILGAEAPRGNPEALYTIISLTEDQMILYVPNNEGGTGWTWVFKAVE